MKKFELERLLFIEALILNIGQINRQDITDRYSISIKTAARLFAKYKDICPDQMNIEKSSGENIKTCYRRSKTCKPCLFTTKGQAQKLLESMDLINGMLDIGLDNFDEIKKSRVEEGKKLC